MDKVHLLKTFANTGLRQGCLLSSAHSQPCAWGREVSQFVLLEHLLLLWRHGRQASVLPGAHSPAWEMGGEGKEPCRPARDELAKGHSSVEEGRANLPGRGMKG